MSSSPSRQTLRGLATARGFVAGPVFVYRGDGDAPVPEYVVEKGREEDEVVRLARAVTETKRDLENLVAALRERSVRGGERIFEAHLMLLEDPMIVSEAESRIRKDRLNAEAAVRRTVDKARELFARMNDPYLRERTRDLDDVERRILRALAGMGGGPRLELRTPSVIVANDLTPSETVLLPRDCVLGFAMNGGSTTSHVALLARAMGVPAVSGLGDVTGRVRAGDTVLLDGTNGTVTLNPSAAEIMEFRDLVERQMEITEEASLGYPAGTLRGGGEVKLEANLHPGVPTDDVMAHGARGIGLYRSEYLWFSLEREPTEDEQAAAYGEAAAFAASLGPDAAVTIRALDVGGDKAMRGISVREANPFLGNRSIRYLLSHRDVFRTQLRAILRASASGRVRLMYPMVSCVEELRGAAEVLAEARGDLDAAGVAYDANMRVGMMVEVPSAAINAAAFAKLVDFFSIGTNDLVQYVMAADRGNDSVANLYQPTNPAVLRLVRETVAAAKARGIPVSVCGESASDPVVGILWAAMGVDALSMPATYIPVISKLLSRLSRADLDELLAASAAPGDGASGGEVMEACRSWLAARIPDIGNIVL